MNQKGWLLHYLLHLPKFYWMKKEWVGTVQICMFQYKLLVHFQHILIQIHLVTEIWPLIEDPKQGKAQECVTFLACTLNSIQQHPTHSPCYNLFLLLPVMQNGPN